MVFKSLGEDQLKDIVRTQLAQVEKRLEDKKIHLIFDESCLGLLAKRGFDPVFGARPLKRVIQTEILNPLAKNIISGEVQAGQTVKLSGDDLHISFETIGSKESL